MSAFREMDPADVLRAIEGYQDELTCEREEQRKLNESIVCPRCRDGMTEEGCGNHPFGGRWTIPKKLLRCPSCKMLLDPDTNLILESGNPAGFPLTAIPIIR